MNESLRRVNWLAILLVVGATSAFAETNPDRASLETAIRRWVVAVNAHDVDALMQTMTEDVELMEPAAAARGRDAALRVLRDTAARGKLVATSRELTIANGMAWHVVALAESRKNGEVHPRGQALEIWKRVNGQWRLHRRMATVAAEPVHSPTRPSTKDPVLDRPQN